MGFVKIRYVCAQCGREIEPADTTHDGEEYCEVNGEKVHLECMFDWSMDHKKECKDEYICKVM